MQDVSGKVAFITGGSSGIGLGIARAFADAGMNLVITYQTPEHLDEAMRQLASAADRVHPIKLDVTDHTAMEGAAAEVTKVFGKVHVLVNNAGITWAAPLSYTTHDDWNWVIGVNLNGVFNGIHAFLPMIRAHGEGGHIVTTASILGLFVAGGGHAAYVASKFAVIGMMEALRAELAPTNIGVSILCPGMVSSNVVNSNRSRPQHFSNTLFRDDPETIARKTAARRNPEYALDPLEVGHLVLSGMRNNDLYLLTHPKYEEILNVRHEALIASVPREMHPTDARLALVRNGLRDCIYSRERDRKLGQPELSD